MSAQQDSAEEEEKEGEKEGEGECALQEVGVDSEDRAMITYA